MGGGEEDDDGFGEFGEDDEDEEGGMLGGIGALMAGSGSEDDAGSLNEEEEEEDGRLPGAVSQEFNWSTAASAPNQPPAKPIELPPLAKEPARVLAGEVEKGRHEYKQMLVGLSQSRVVHLVTQLRWRLREGAGEMFYHVGRADDGQPVGATPEELDETLRNLQRIAAGAGAEMQVVELSRPPTVAEEVRRLRREPAYAASVLSIEAERRRVRQRRAAVAGAGQLCRLLQLPEALGLTGREAAVEDGSGAPPAGWRPQSAAEEVGARSRRLALVRMRGRSQGPGRQCTSEVRVAVVGPSESGKSTLVAVLTQGGLDDGHGDKRLEVLRHTSEMDDGRTTSVSTQVLGFDAGGSPVTGGEAGLGGMTDWEDVVKQSEKVVVFHDTAGQERYMARTALLGLLGTSPDCVLLCVDSSRGVVRQTKELLATCFALHIPVMVAITKADLTATPAVAGQGASNGKEPARPGEDGDAGAAAAGGAGATGAEAATPHQHDRATQAAIEVCRLARTNRRHLAAFSADAVQRRRSTETLPFQSGLEGTVLVADEGGVEVALEGLRRGVAMTPVVRMSCVTGQGLPLALALLAGLPRRREWSQLELLPPLMHLNQAFEIGKVGLVVGGTVFAGALERGQRLLLGPDGLGRFKPVLVRSIHALRLPVQAVPAGHTATCSLLDPLTQRRLGRAAFRRGMVLVSNDLQPTASRSFEAEVLLVRHPSQLRVGAQLVLSARTVRQAAVVEAILPVKRRGGDARRLTGELDPWETDSGTDNSERWSEAEGAVRPDEHRSHTPNEHRSHTPLSVGGRRRRRRRASLTEPVAGAGSPFMLAGNVRLLRLRWHYHAEYMASGTPLLVRDGQIRAIGRVIRQLAPTPAPAAARGRSRRGTQRASVLPEAGVGVLAGFSSGVAGGVHASGATSDAGVAASDAASRLPSEAELAAALLAGTEA